MAWTLKAQKPLSNAELTQLFKLPEAQGKSLSLTPETKGVILIFTCNHCPFARLYTSRFNALQEKYASLGVPVVAVNSMDTMIYEDETFPYMQEKASAEAYTFAYLQDAGQQWGWRLGAQSTPSAFVLWRNPDGWRVKYFGSIDDNGEAPEKATPFVGQAVDALLQGRQVAVPQTKSFGCAIEYSRKKVFPKKTSN